MDCLNSYMELHNFSQYIGEDLGCKTYAVLLKYENQFYFQRQNNCIRIRTIIETCGGVEVCIPESEIDCDDFIENYVSHGVFFIEG